jgi:carbon monoxide dehydrogenase subunit G
MRLAADIPIDAPPDEVFALLGSPERVTAWLSGATGEPGGFRADALVPTGSGGVRYGARVRYRSVRSEERSAAVTVRATERGGQGGAEATIRSTVAPSATGSLLRLDADLRIRGTLARAGRDDIEEAVGRLLSDLAQSAERALNSRSGAVGPPPVPAPVERRLGRATTAVAVLALTYVAVRAARRGRRR